MDDNDYNTLMRWKWTAEVSNDNYRVYAKRRVRMGTINPKYKCRRQVNVYMHSQLMNTPKGMVTDHIDHNTLNNQKANLRICTDRDNLIHGKKRGTKFTYKGVQQNNYDGTYSAWIINHCERFYLGTHKTPEDAARAYDKKAVELHREFAYLNFPEEWGQPKHNAIVVL